MNLLELIKRMIEQTPGYYARALRVIGQDLQDLLPEKLTIELRGDSFVASGTCTKSRIDDQAGAAIGASLKSWASRFLKGIFKTPRPGEPELEFVPFNRTYHAQDIERLDAQGTRHRSSTGMPDIYTLGERLRTIGKVIDAHNGRAVRIFKDLHQINFEYQDGSGVDRRVKFSNTELYQLQRQYAAERGAGSR